jgi:patatin-like phospholipase/acyl hydrolase
MSSWGHLEKRFGTERPRKLLALDGGGIRGVLSLEILAEIERKIADKTGIKRLGDYFDYIGGTSTGAIIAAGLSIGMRAAELLSFYREAGVLMFEKNALLKRLKSIYTDEPLAAKLQGIFREHNGEQANLTSERLLCLLLVVTRNMTTDSPWPITSNPFAKYNDPGRGDDNRRIPLWQLVRASTAAPVFFPPEILNWDPDDPNKSFVFVDGGLTPYNNPAFLLFRMATQPAYRLEWKTGERELLLVSVGTGAAAGVTDAVERNLFGNMQNLPSELMYGIQVDQDINCRTFGRCVHGSEIDREMGNLILANEGTPAQVFGRFFRYVRYNADLSQKGLNDLGLADIEAAAVQKMDAVDQIENLSRVGKAVAQKEVSIEHFGPFV